MQVIPLPDTLESLRFEASPDRTPGLHLSAIIKSLAQSLDPERFADGPLDLRRTDSGFTFERVLEMAFASRREGIFRPPEMEVDGVLMSPDGVDPDGWILEEYKSTWMSSRGCPTHPKFVHWLWQIKGYCLALHTTRARLRVMFFCGDYSRPITPEFKCWDLRFTQRELEQNWQMLLTHAREKGML